jgi:AcrR family transcriptional regulator
MRDVTQEDLKLLRTTVDLCRENGFDAVTFDAVAERSGVAAASLRDRWATPGALVIDAFRTQLAGDLIYPDTGDFAADMHAQLMAIAKVFHDPATGPHIARIVGEAQRAPAMAEEFRARVYVPNRKAARARFQRARTAGQIRADVDIDTAIDLTFAPFWFRMLLKSGPLDEDYVKAIVDLSLHGLLVRS